MKDKYLIRATRWWLATVCWLSLTLAAQAQSTQPPSIKWQRVVEASGTSGPVNGRPVVTKTNEGGYAVLTGDKRLLYLTSSGDIVVDRAIVPVNSGGDAGSTSTVGIVAATDGGVIISLQDTRGSWLQKRNVNGDVTWEYPLWSNQDGYQYSIGTILNSVDGGFVMFANYQDNKSTVTKAYVVANKFTSSGAVEWSRIIDYPGAASTRVAQATRTNGSSNGGYMLAGSTYANYDGNTFFRGWTARLDEQGNVIRQTRYDSINGLNGITVYQNSGDRYIINGPSFTNPTGNYTSSSFLIDDLGALDRSLPVAMAPFPSYNSAATIVNVPVAKTLSSYVVANETPVDQNGGDIRLTGFSNLGTVAWTKTLGGSGREYGYQPSVVAIDNGYVVVGITESTDGDVLGKQTKSPATWIVKLQSPDKTLTLAQPGYNCTTGLITFISSGGDGSPITYNAPGVSRSSPTSNQGVVEQGLRNDPKPILITATQSGETAIYSFDFGAFCSSTPRLPVIDNPIPSLTLSVGIGLTTPISNYFQQSSGYYLTFRAIGLPPGLHFFEELAVRTAYITGVPTMPGVYPVTVTATNPLLPSPDNSVSATFTITVLPTFGTDPPTPPSTGGSLVLTPPTYNCTTGAITFNTTGGDGTPITYSAPGISRSSLSSATGIIEQGLRNDPKPITIIATQSGNSNQYVFDFLSYCTTGMPPVILSPIPNYTFSVGQNVFEYVNQYFSRRPANPVTFTASSLPKGLSFTNIPSVNEGLLAGVPSVPGVYTVTVTATDPLMTPPANAVSSTFTITIIDKPTAPPTGSTFTLLAPVYDCATGAITFQTSGGNGSSIEYAAAGITGWTTNPNQFVDRDSRTANDVQPFILMARQNGVTVQYEWNLKAACGRARVGTVEPEAELSLTVMGNPATDRVRVRVGGVNGRSVRLVLSDAGGRMLEGRIVDGAEGNGEQVFDVQRSLPGLLLLRATTATQTKAVKILKQ